MFSCGLFVGGVSRPGAFSGESFCCGDPQPLRFATIESKSSAEGFRIEAGLDTCSVVCDRQEICGGRKKIKTNVKGVASIIGILGTLLTGGW